ncbi:hypothetical protein PG984_011823 [Apiospora sp. TS-2023a]
MQSFATILALWATITLAWDASKMDCDDDPLCFTSFVWCDLRGRSGCSYPEGVYPPTVDPQDIDYALVMENVNYTISWKVQGQHPDKPVQVQWALGEGISWTVNTTERQVIFNPGQIVNSLFQEDATTGGGSTIASTNVTHLLDTVYSIYSGEMTVITISQPEAADPDAYPGYPGNIPGAWSSRFIVTSALTGRFLDAQRDIEYKKWRLGVGIGVGLCVPILMAGTALGTWILGKRIGWRKNSIAATSKD